MFLQRGKQRGHDRRSGSCIRHWHQERVMARLVYPSFPKGPEDPEYILLKFRGNHATIGLTASLFTEKSKFPPLILGFFTFYFHTRLSSLRHLIIYMDVLRMTDRHERNSRHQLQTIRLQNSSLPYPTFPILSLPLCHKYV